MKVVLEVLCARSSFLSIVEDAQTRFLEIQIVSLDQFDPEKHRVEVTGQYPEQAIEYLMNEHFYEVSA